MVYERNHKRTSILVKCCFNGSYYTVCVWSYGEGAEGARGGEGFLLGGRDFWVLDLTAPGLGRKGECAEKGSSGLSEGLVGGLKEDRGEGR